MPPNPLYGRFGESAGISDTFFFFFRGACLLSPHFSAECLGFKSNIHPVQFAYLVVLLPDNWWIIDHPIMDAMGAVYEMEITT